MLKRSRNYRRVLLAWILTLLVLGLLMLAQSQANAQTATPTPSDTFNPASGNQCPNVAPANKWRFASKATQRPDGLVDLCLQIVAGEEAVDLNDTVIINLPPGATPSKSMSQTGKVTLEARTIRWGSFRLNAFESSSVLITLSAADVTNLTNNTSITISGRFNRGQAFQGRIPNLAPLTEVEVLSNGTFEIFGPGAPSTGYGPAVVKTSPDLAWWLAGLLSLSGTALLAGRRQRRRQS